MPWFSARRTAPGRTHVAFWSSYSLAALFPEGSPYFLVAPPRLRRATPVSVRRRWTNPYDRPVEVARDRMDSPASYLLFKSVASLLRSAPVTRVPFLRVSATFTSRKV